MKTIDKHGLKINGLKKASGDTWDWCWRDGQHNDIYFDMSTGDVWTVHHSTNWWTAYGDPNVIAVCSSRRHMTMQEIADAISFRLVEVSARGDY